VRYLPVLSGDREIRLVILGKSDTEYGREVIARLLSLESARFRLSYYPGVVPQAEYEAQLSAADLLWSPIRVSTVGIRKTAETYGLSTSTGLTGDILLNCTPVLVPEGFAVPEYFEAAMPTYRSPEDLAAQIAAFINDPAFVRDNRKRILHDLSFFVKGNFQKPFEELMDLDEANG
jgi:glycosyltransferase involved in cell wall biosynthesis